MYRIIDFVLERYKLIFVVTLFLTIPFIYGYLNQDFINSIESYFENDDPNIAAYQKFQAQFGNEEFAVIAFQDKTVLTVKNLNFIKKITELAQSYKGIQNVKSLTNLELIVGYGDTVDFKQVIPSGDITDDTISIARDILDNHKPFKHNLVSNDFRTTAVFIEIEPTMNNKDKIRVLRQIRGKTERIAAGAGVRLYYCGIPYIESNTSELIENDIRLFTPVFLMVVLGLMILVTGNFPLVTLILSCALIPSVTGIGLLITSGETVNSITLHTGTILLILSLINAAHIVSNYRKDYLQNGYNHRKAVEKTSKAQWVPCFLTALATSVIFFSYAATSLRSVKIAGVFTGVGILHVFLTTMVFLPSVLMVFRKWIDTRPRKPELLLNHFFEKILGYICRFAILNRRPIIFLFVCVCGVLAYGITNLHYDTNFSRYLRDDSRVYRDSKFVENNLTGTVRTELVVKALSDNYSFNKPEGLLFLKELQAAARQHMAGQYMLSYSVADYMAEMHMAFNGGQDAYYKVPEITVEINDYYELGDDSVLKKIVTPDKREARISFFSKMEQSDQTNKFADFLEKFKMDKQDSSYGYVITGRYSLSFRLEQNLKKSLTMYLSIVGCLLMAVLVLLTRNLKLSIASFLPIIFPFLCVFGVMGLSGLPVYTSTMMIVGITAGVTADSIIRFLFEFNRQFSNGQAFEEAIGSTFQGPGKIIFLSLIILALSFCIFIAGSTSPVVNLGILTSMAFIATAISVLLVMPALLGLIKIKDTGNGGMI